MSEKFKEDLNQIINDFELDEKEVHVFIRESIRIGRPIDICMYLHDCFKIKISPLRPEYHERKQKMLKIFSLLFEKYGVFDKNELL